MADPQAHPIHTPDTTVQQNVDSFRRTMQAAFDRKERERLGLAPDTSSEGEASDGLSAVDPVVQIVLEKQYEEFGFVIYRANYDDEAKWLRWYEKFDELFDASLEAASGGSKVMDRLITYPVEDEELNHLPFLALHDYHKLMKEDQTFSLGVDNGVAVAVDSSVLNALLEPAAGVPPWVYVFDENHDFPPGQGDAGSDEYPGYMPVAIDSLLTDLWPGLQSGLSLMELWATWNYDEEHPVWTNALGV